jgi:cob(I)alamin adenosyltransferase
MDDPGYVQVYTGNGKGKTTAALGMALRAAGAGWGVFFARFVKGMAYSELAALESLSDRITVRQFGRACFIDREAEQADIDCAEQGFMECKEAARSAEYRMVVLDEVSVAVAFGLVRLDDLIDLVDGKPRNVELVLTGRWAHRHVISRADLVTEMQESKHDYEQGVLTRVGVKK